MGLEIEIFANDHPAKLAPQKQHFTPGECHIIMGQSGAGKSTLLMAIAGLNKEIPVHVRLEKKNLITRVRTVPIHRRPLIYQPHQKVLFEAFNVRKNLDYAEKNQRLNSYITQKKLVDLLGLEEFLNKMPNELSGGQYQRALLARTLLSGKSWILLDEPTLHLDPIQQSNMTSLLKDLVRMKNQNFIIVTHSLSLAADLGHRYYVLKSGKIQPVSHPNKLAQIFKYSEMGPASIIKTKLVNNHPELGLSETQIIDSNDKYQTLWIPLRTEKTGAALHLLIHAQDIAVSKTLLKESSILNQLQAQVKKIEQAPQHVVLECETAGQYLFAMISLKSFSEMSLKVGDWVYTCFKARALTTKPN